jgi:hypothetical protein
MRTTLGSAMVGALATGAAAQLVVTSTLPALNALNVPGAAAVQVTFDRAVNPATFTQPHFNLFGRFAGPIAGTFSFSNQDRTVTFTPVAPFMAGDQIRVVMSHDLRGTDNTPLRPGGYTLTFTVAVAPSAGEFCNRGRFSDRSAGGAQTRIYGAQASDLNRDGWPDLTLVNEVSADLRVFLNTGNPTGPFGTMVTPPTPIPVESSPNKPADFNNDGFVDICTTSNDTSQLTIALGRGDGSFNPPTILTFGGYLRGIAILDADGDGDVDIAVSSRDTDQIALLINNGAGVFAAPTFFPSGGDGPYGLAAADMNNDGLLDLVCGNSLSQTVTVLRAVGDGTFALASSRAIGGANWVVACGDLNGDGNMDVTAANAGSANGSVLLGNGNGTLQPMVTYPNGGHTTGTELADIDGDGDLDWLISSYGAGRWYLYRNNGAGSFSLARTFDAPGNPACAVTADFDRDGDIDLVLLDETTDWILVMLNNTPACAANCDCSQTGPALNVNDFLCFMNRFAAGDPWANCDGSTTPPVLNVNDFVCFQGAFAAGCP